MFSNTLYDLQITGTDPQGLVRFSTGTKIKTGYGTQSEDFMPNLITCQAGELYLLDPKRHYSIVTEKV